MKFFIFLFAYCFAVANDAKKPSKRSHPLFSSPSNAPSLSPITQSIINSPSFSPEIPSQLNRPSMVIMIGDDFGWGDFSYLNKKSVVNTVNIDAMAFGPNTIQLNRFHSEVNCSPSRVAILTGRIPVRDCVRGAPSNTDKYKSLIRPNADSVIALAKSLGYVTYHIGKYPESNDMSYPITWPTQMGFTQWKMLLNGMTYNTTCWCDDYKSGHWLSQCYAGHFTPPAPLVLAPPYDVHQVIYPPITTQIIMPHNYTISPDNTHYVLPRNIMQAQYVANEFDSFLNDLPQSTPYLAVLAFREAHVPFLASPELRKQCLQTNACRGAKTLSSKTYDYAGCILAVDAAVGQIRNSIVQRRDDWNNTITILLSDNGPEDYDLDGDGSTGGLRGRKRSLLEGGLRVPCLIEWPARIFQNVASAALTSILDIPVTIEHLLRGSVSPDRDGVSLLSLIDNPSQTYVREKTLFICQAVTSGNTDSDENCPFYALYDVTGTYKIIQRNFKFMNVQPDPSSPSPIGFYYVDQESETPPFPAIDATLNQLGLRWTHSVNQDFKRNCRK